MFGVRTEGLRKARRKFIFICFSLRNMLMKGFETFLNIDAMLIYRIFFTMFAPYLYAEIGTMRYTSTIWRILQINFWPRGNAIF